MKAAEDAYVFDIDMRMKVSCRRKPTLSPREDLRGGQASASLGIVLIRPRCFPLKVSIMADSPGSS